MDEHYYRDKIPKHFAGLFFDRVPTEKIDGKWLVVHGQRSTGRKPGDPYPIFPKN